MAILNNSFYQQVSLATIRKDLKVEGVQQLEFWEAEINFTHNKSDFKFEIIQPEKNRIYKKYIQDKPNFYDEEYDKPLERRGNVKRFWSKDDAEFYILFNLMQVYKPLHNYISENNISDKFNQLIDEHPEKFVAELGKGNSWLVN